MSTFVKVCPKCAHPNPEYENACELCAYFIGMESPIPAPESSATEKEDNANHVNQEVSQSSELPTIESNKDGQELTKPLESELLYLELIESDHVYGVQNRWIVGQAHESSTANLQLSNISGDNYMHRNHCQFLREGSEWHVKPIDQRIYGRAFTNPTVLNYIKLEPGETAVLKSGDQLILAGVQFVVRFL